jgi:hypothetical protein
MNQSNRFEKSKSDAVTSLSPSARSLTSENRPLSGLSVNSSLPSKPATEIPYRSLQQRIDRRRKVSPFVKHYIGYPPTKPARIGSLPVDCFLPTYIATMPSGLLSSDTAAIVKSDRDHESILSASIEHQTFNALINLVRMGSTLYSRIAFFPSAAMYIYEKNLRPNGYFRSKQTHATPALGPVTTKQNARPSSCSSPAMWNRSVAPRPVFELYSAVTVGASAEQSLSKDGGCAIQPMIDDRTLP